MYDCRWILRLMACLLPTFLFFFQDVGLWLEEINLGGYRQIFKENGVNGEYLEGMSMFTTEQILRFIRRCHMKWGDFITLCKELRRIKGLIYLSFSLFFSQKFWPIITFIVKLILCLGKRHGIYFHLLCLYHHEAGV